jgi:hypothetical protein
MFIIYPVVPASITMSGESRRTGGGAKWTEITAAGVAGFVVLNLILHGTFLAGIGGPQAATQLVMWVAVVGVAAFLLVRRGIGAGYLLSYLTGVLGIGVNVVVGSGLLGDLGATSPSPVLGFVLGPVAYTALAVAVIAATYLARRERERGTDAGRRDPDPAEALASDTQ